jgi:hypothetical protein
MNNDKAQNHQDDEIPLLEDVITPNEVEIRSDDTSMGKAASGVTHASVPAYDEALLTLRDEIAAQLEDDLRPMIAKATERAIKEATERIDQILHDELDTTLEHRIRWLIAHHMAHEFGPRERHLGDDESV